MTHPPASAAYLNCFSQYFLLPSDIARLERFYHKNSTINATGIFIYHYFNDDNYEFLKYLQVIFTYYLYFNFLPTKFPAWINEYDYLVSTILAVEKRKAEELRYSEDA